MGEIVENHVGPGATQLVAVAAADAVDPDDEAERSGAAGLHTRDGVAVSALECGLLPLNQTSLAIRGKISVHEYEGVAVNTEERARLVRDLGENDLMFLRNHGTLAVGPTVAEAFQRMYLRESACTVQVRTLSMGQPWHMPDARVVEHMDKHAGRRNEHSANYARNLVWPALLRKLDRTCPDYKS